MKTILITTASLFLSMALYSQIIKPTRYNLDSLHKPTTKEDYKYIRVVENYKDQANLFIYTEYFLSGKISMKAISTNKETPKFEGPRIDYYENGNKKQESNYKDNKLNGRQTEWYENKYKKSERELTWNPKTKDYNAKILQFWNQEGQQTVIDSNGYYEYSDKKIHEKGELRNGKKQGVWEGNDLEGNFSFKEIYHDGKFISGISSDENNNKFPYKVFTENAKPEKGITDFYQHIGRNYKAPNIKGLKGKIYLTFIINKDGSVSNIKVLRDLGYGTGQEGVKVVSSYKKWIPGKTRGIPSKTSFSLPISIMTSGVDINQSFEPTLESEMIRNTNPHW